MTDEAPLPVTGEEAAPGMGCVWVSSRIYLLCWVRMGLVVCHVLNEH